MISGTGCWLCKNFSKSPINLLTKSWRGAKHSIEILNDILNLEKNLTQTIRENTGNRANNNLRLLEKLFQMPFIKVEDVREQLEVSSATAKNIGYNYSYSGNGFFNKFK
jgi:hypothetical protein